MYPAYTDNKHDDKMLPLTGVDSLQHQCHIVDSSMS